MPFEHDSPMGGFRICRFCNERSLISQQWIFPLNSIYRAIVAEVRTPEHPEGNWRLTRIRTVGIRTVEPPPLLEARAKPVDFS